MLTKKLHTNFLA